MVGAHPTDQTWCVLKDLKMLYQPDGPELTTALSTFLEQNGLREADVEVLINGASGDRDDDQKVNAVSDILFPHAVHLKFKHLSGEYCTSSSLPFGLVLLL